MTLFNWILTGFLIADAGLIILSMIKNLALLKKISCAIFMPLASPHIPLMLALALPDSYHTLVITSAALALISISLALSVIFEHKIAGILAQFFFLAGICLWCRIFKYVFYVYRLPQWAVVSIIILCVIIAVMPLVFLGRMQAHNYVFLILLTASSLLLAVFAFVLLIFERNTRAVILFSASIVNLAAVIFSAVPESKITIKEKTPIRIAAVTASQILIAISAMLVFF